MNQPLAEEIRPFEEEASLRVLAAEDRLRAFQAAVRESWSQRPANDNGRPAAAG